MIYFDSAATTFQRPPCVGEAMLHALAHCASPGRGAYAASLDAARLVWQCRKKLANLFHCPDPARVVFTSGATESLNLTLWGLLKPGDHVIATAIEHNSVLRPLYALQARGVQVELLPADSMGRVDWSILPAHIRPQTKVVVTAHASNVTGTVQDIRAIGACCREHGVSFVVDAAQTAGAQEINLQRDGISVLCFPGHKGLLGPAGVGGLCVAPGVELPAVKTGGSGVQSFLHGMPEDLPERLEAGTVNTPGIAGLSAALDFLRETGMERLRQQADAVCRRFVASVTSIPGIVLYGDVHAEKRAPIVLLNLREMPAAALSDALAEQYDICTRAGAHCAPLMHEALGTDRQGAVRFSFSPWNTDAEIDQAVRALRALAGA